LSSPSPARQFWPHVVADADGDRAPAAPELVPHGPPRRRLNPSEKRLVRWLDRYCVVRIPKDLAPAAVEGLKDLPAFVGARLFVMKYGSRLILGALHEMTDVYEEEEGRVVRRWQAAIVSPAQYLHWYVRQMARVEGP